MSEFHGDDYWLSLLVRTALDQDQLSGYAKMLRTVAESVNCDACIVWRVTPGSDLTTDPPTGHLFALAQWSEKGNVWTTHELSFTSATGRAVRASKADLINDIHHHAGVDPHDNFFTRTGMKKFCTIPILFTRDKGAVAIYRLADCDISDEEFARAQLLAKVLPLLYRTIRDRASFRLIGDVNERLREAEANGVETEEAMRQVCDAVNMALGCRETSVFLETPHEKRGVYHCYYTTEKLFVGDKVDYVPPEKGLTPWVLENRRGVQIFDLRLFTQDRAQIEARYPGISWEDRQGVVQHATRRPLAGNPAPQRAPVSFMAAPIMIGSEVRGVIRCCLASSPPYYFAPRELQLLDFIASRISQYWGHRLTLQESDSKTRFWQYLADGVRRINVFVHEELSQEEPNKLSIYAEALRILRQVIPEADSGSVRLLETNKGRLVDALPSPNSRLRHFNLGENSRFAGADVFHGREAKIVIMDGRPEYGYEFGEAKSAVVAPVWSGHKVVGVLDILSNRENAFGQEVKSLAELWGRQLGLYDHLAGSILAVKVATEQQAQAYIDLEHQLKSPLITALRRIQKALTDKTEIDLFALRGQIKRAYRVSRNVALFADLAAKQRPPIKPARLTKDETVRRIIEYCMDLKVAVQKSTVGFFVYPDGFDHLEKYEVTADSALFEHALNNVLDNAFKYSFSRETVEVRAGIEDDSWFFISICDTGLSIRPDQAAKCKARNWRSESAESVTGEGSGIGLWIVDEIMKAHSGTLVVCPTSAGITEVRLLWPCQKPVLS